MISIKTLIKISILIYYISRANIVKLNIKLWVWQEWFSPEPRKKLNIKNLSFFMKKKFSNFMFFHQNQIFQQKFIFSCNPFNKMKYFYLYSGENKFCILFTRKQANKKLFKFIYKKIKVRKFLQIIYYHRLCFQIECIAILN